MHHSSRRGSGHDRRWASVGRLHVGKRGSGIVYGMRGDGCGVRFRWMEVDGAGREW